MGNLALVMVALFVMATKNYGIIYKVAGVEEAQAGLDRLRKNLNKSLVENKKIARSSRRTAIETQRKEKEITQAKQEVNTGYLQSLRDNLDRQLGAYKKAVRSSLRTNIEKTRPQQQEKLVPQRGDVAYDYIDNYQRTFQALKNQNYKQAVDIYSRPRINSVTGGFFEGIGSAAGGRAFDKVDDFVRRLTGREEHTETVSLSDRSIVKIGDAVARSLTGKTRTKEATRREKSLGKTPKLFLQQESFAKKLLNQFLEPIKTIRYSFFEGIGANFGDRFAEGLNKVFEQDLDISFERKGEVSGKGIANAATEGLGNFKTNAAKVGDNFNAVRYDIEDGNLEGISAKFDTLFKSVTKTITSVADSYLRGFRKGSVQLEALRKIEQEIAKQENQAPDLTGKDRAIFTVSGFAGEGGQRGKFMAEQLKPYIKDTTAVIGAENQFTDVLSPSDKNPVLWGVSALANLAKINLKGFNPDAVKLAAQVINALAKNPELKQVDLLGHSAGGFVVEEAQEILTQLGYSDKVKANTVGTPNLLGNLDNANTSKVIGDNDFRIKPLEQALEYLGISDPTDKDIQGVKDHFFQDYLDSDDFLNNVIGDNLDPEKVKTKRQDNSKFSGKLIELETLYTKYISAIYDNIEELSDELSVAPDRLFAKSRRNKLEDRGVNEVNRKLRDKDFNQVKLKEETKEAILVIGGLSGAGGRSGSIFAKQIQDIAKEPGTQYIGARNPFTDVLTPDDIRNPDPKKATQKVLEVFEKTEQLGYNPDAAEIAAQVIDLLNRDPNLKVKIGGYSAGGYVAEDVIALLKAQGADTSRVSSVGVGTPELPGGIKNREFTKLLGEKDPIGFANNLKEINEQIKSAIGFDVFPDLVKKLQNIEGIESHDLQDYLANSEEVQNFFYGNLPSKDLLGKYQQIQNKTAQTRKLDDQIADLDKDSSLGFAAKLPKLLDLRKEYVKVAKQIEQLAKEAVAAGGGKYFKKFLPEPQPTPQQPKQTQPAPQQAPSKDVADPWEDAAQNYQERYRFFLEKMSKQLDPELDDTVNLLVRDFELNSQQERSKSLASYKKNFNQQAKKYRQAVKAGELELAKEEGEKLLKLSIFLKKIYGKLGESDQIDEQTKSKLLGLTRYNTSVQNEVISGQKGKGRVNQGLPDIFQEEVDKSQQTGVDFAQGFIEGVRATLDEAKEAGAEIIDAADQGVRDQGEIRSPSRLAKRLGRWFARGFGVGIEEEADNLEERGREVVGGAVEGVQEQIGESLNADNIASLLDTGGAGLIKKLGSLIYGASNSEDFDKTLDQIGQLAGKVIRLFVTFKLLKVGLDALGLGKFIGAFQNLPEEALNSAIAVEALDKRIIDMSGSARAGARNLKFITAEAERLNINLSNAKENFSQVLRGTRDTSLEGFQTENIFTAFASTAKANALSREDETQLFRSVRSILGKGVVSQEEVRQEIGERLGDFEQSLAQAYGVSRPELNKLIGDGKIRAEEALPKVAAVLRAKNDIEGDSTTGAAAAQRVDNAIGSFQESVGFALLPLQKAGNNFLAGFFNKVAGWIDTIKPLVNGFFLALFVNLLRLQILGQSVQKLLLGLVKVLWSLKGAMGLFLAEMLLIAAAWKTWENVIKIFNSRYFPEINKDLEKLTRGMQAYRQAIDEARGSQENLGNTKLQLSEGLKLPENKFGDAIRKTIGSDYLNLDSLVREPLDKLLSNKLGRVATQSVLPLVPGGSQIAPFLPKGFTTRREQKEQNLKIGNARLSVKGNALLNDSQEAFEAAKQISEYDKQIAAIQSARLKILPGDQDALTASLAEEKKINKERDKQLRVLTAFQQTLTTSITVYKKRLEDLQAKFLSGEIDQNTFTQQNQELTGLLDGTESLLKEVNGELSKTAKVLTVFQRNLNNRRQRVEGFTAQADRELQQQRTGIILDGIDQGQGTQTIQLELEEAQQQDLTRRIKFVKTELNQLEKDLNSAELAPATQRVRQFLAEKNIPLNEGSLQEIIDKSTVQADKDAAAGLIEQLKLETQAIGFQEQYAQNLQQSRNSLLDYSRTVSDYFFNLTQRIKEAQIETKTLLSQLFATDIRNKLRSAIQGESFVNGIIESIQGVLDQAQQLIERSLGLESSGLQFESEQRQADQELKDFTRNISGASDALLEFRRSLGVGNGGNSSTSNKPVTSRGAAFPIPGLNLDKAPISSGFGWRKIFGRDDFHEGIDIAVKGGTDVVAVRDGIVKQIRPLADQLQVNVQSVNAAGQKVSEWFIHLSKKLNVKVGDRLSAGQKIGEVAHTTNTARRARVSTGDHLDYRIQVAGKWVNPKQALKNVSARVTPQPQAQLVSNQSGEFPTQGSGIIGQAQQLNRQLVAQKQQSLGLNRQLLNQEKTALSLQKQRQLASQERQLGDNQRESDRNLFGIKDRLFGFINQGRRQTAQIEYENQLRQAQGQFRDFENELFTQTRGYEDTIRSLENFIKVAPEAIAKFRAEGDNGSADFLAESAKQFEAALPAYKNLVSELGEVKKQLPEIQNQALKFLKEQAELKIQAEKFNKQSQLQQLKSNIAAQRGTNEQKRKSELAAEELRLQTAINQIKQNTPAGEFRDSLISAENRTSEINRENIDKQALERELTFERQLLDLDSGINNGRADGLSLFGFDKEATKLKRETAIAQENSRFRDQLLQIERDFAGEAEKIDELKTKAAELNQVNLDGIKQQFSGLGKIIRENTKNSLDGFFNNAFAAFGNGGDKQLKLLEQELAYKNELVAINNKYKQGSAEIDFARARAKELNEQKLDKINKEFDIFTRIVNAGKKALQDFLLEIVKVAAKKAALGVTNALFGTGGQQQAPTQSTASGVVSAIGGAAKLFFGGGFRDGGEIPSKDRIVPKPISNRLQNISNPIRSAFNREGSKGVLGVFTPGEEILSIKTGEAGRYQALKSQLGNSPLDKIFAGNFMNGGTIDIEGNLLAQLPTPRNNINLSAITEPRSRRQFQQKGDTYLYATIQTPNADSFNASEYQIQQALGEKLRRDDRAYQ